MLQVIGAVCVNRIRRGLLLAMGLGVSVPWSGVNTARAVEARPTRTEMVQKGIGYLRGIQAADGSFAAKELGPAGTSLALTALLKNGVSAEDPAIVSGLRYLRTFQQADGGFYKPESKHRNYETSLVCMCLAAARETSSDATQVREYKLLLEGAAAFLKRDQWDEGENLTPNDAAYGGSGYGSHERPDLSNTSFMLDALHELGTSPDDPAIQRALKFVSRCQNLESPDNTTPFPAKNPDGGFYYTPAAGGNSQAGTTDNGGLRSYASMTYAGLRSLIYAGVNRQDRRVAAAHAWLTDHYSVTDNPGLGQQGLFYYYHTFAKTLAAWSEPKFVDKAGRSHDWKDDLISELGKRQQSDGSWTNPQPRWLEDNPVLVTSYSLLALSYCGE